MEITQQNINKFTYVTLTCEKIEELIQRPESKVVEKFFAIFDVDHPIFDSPGSLKTIDRTAMIKYSGAKKCELWIGEMDREDHIQVFCINDDELYVVDDKLKLSLVPSSVTIRVWCYPVQIQHHQLPDQDDEITAPILTKLGYRTHPDIDTLRRLEVTNPQALTRIRNFSIERIGVGRITWLHDVDVSGLNLDNLVEIEESSAEVYPEQLGYLEDPVGTKLNTPCQVVLYNIESKKMKEAGGIQHVSDRDIDAYRQKLLKLADKNPKMTFISYGNVGGRGEWIFNIEDWSNQSEDRRGVVSGGGGSGGIWLGSGTGPSLGVPTGPPGGHLMLGGGGGGGGVALGASVMDGTWLGGSVRPSLGVATGPLTSAVSSVSGWVWGGRSSLGVDGSWPASRVPAFGGLAKTITVPVKGLYNYSIYTASYKSSNQTILLLGEKHGAPGKASELEKLLIEQTECPIDILVEKSYYDRFVSDVTTNIGYFTQSRKSHSLKGIPKQAQIDLSNPDHITFYNQMIKPYFGRLKIWSIDNRGDALFTNIMDSIATGMYLKLVRDGCSFSQSLADYRAKLNGPWAFFFQTIKSVFNALFNFELYSSDRQTWDIELKRTIQECERATPDEIKSTIPKDLTRKDHFYFMDQLLRISRDKEIIRKICTIAKLSVDGTHRTFALSMIQDISTLSRMIRLIKDPKEVSRVIVVVVGSAHVLNLKELLGCITSEVNLQLVSQDNTLDDTNTYNIKVPIPVFTAPTQRMQKYTQLQSSYAAMVGVAVVVVQRFLLI